MIFTSQPPAQIKLDDDPRKQWQTVNQTIETIRRLQAEVQSLRALVENELRKPDHDGGECRWA